jgi:hypothetical protein
MMNKSNGAGKGKTKREMKKTAKSTPAKMSTMRVGSVQVEKKEVGLQKSKTPSIKIETTTNKKASTGSGSKQANKNSTAKTGINPIGTAPIGKPDIKPIGTAPSRKKGSNIMNELKYY